MTKHSFLAPLTLAEQVSYSVGLINYFTPMNTYETRVAMGSDMTNGIFPLTLGDYLRHIQRSEPAIFKKRQRISEIARKLSAHGILSSHGGVDIAERFTTLREITSTQRKGHLLLGPVLGPRFVAEAVSKDLVHITGKGPNEIDSAGTGVQITDRHIVTCGHVINDMKLDSCVVIRDEPVCIENAIAHPKIDVGLITLSRSVPRTVNDLAFHQSQLLEPILIAGFPQVPLSSKPVLTFQTGEICAQNVEIYLGAELDLFTATARPGNSGGPVLSLNGHIVGIVSRSLESAGGAQGPSSHPFFAAVPACVVREALHKLDPAVVLPWEDYS